MTFDDEIREILEMLRGYTNHDYSKSPAKDIWTDNDKALDAIKSAIKRQLPKRKHNAYSIGFNRCLTTIRRNMGI